MSNEPQRSRWDVFPLYVTVGEMEAHVQQHPIRGRVARLLWQRRWNREMTRWERAAR